LLIQQIAQNFNIAAVAIGIHEIFVQVRDFDCIRHESSASVWFDWQQLITKLGQKRSAWIIRHFGIKKNAVKDRSL
jgi:hypothetical protein